MTDVAVNPARRSSRAAILGFLGRLGTILWGTGSATALALAGYVGVSAQDFQARAVKIEGTVTKVDVKLPPAPAKPSDPNAADPKATTSVSSSPTPAKSAPGNSDAPPKEDPKPSYTATISYKSPAPTGETLALTRETGSEATFKPNAKVQLLVDPKNPAHAEVEAAYNPWLGSALLGLFGVILAFIAWKLSRKPAIAYEEQWQDGDKFNFHPLDPITFEGYLGAGRSAPTGIAATASSIREGKYPLALSEMMAYMSTLAYESDADLERYLNDKFNEISDYRFFDAGDTQGFGFVYEGTAFVVMRGTTGRGDWRQNLRASMTGPTELIPPGVGWSAPPRHRGFAEAWDVVRAQVEEWIMVGSGSAGTGCRRRTRDLSQPGQPFIFTGHSLGGALAFLGAFEARMQGRSVEAVITFGAPMAGRSEWADKYKEIGLDERTLRLVFDQDLVPLVLQYMGYRHVGREWLPAKPPLVHRKVLVQAAIVGALVGLVRWGMTTNKKGWRDYLKGPLAGKIVLFLTYFGPFAIMALAAHKMQTRYSLALSTVSYQRIRQLAAPNRTDAEYADCYRKLCRHLEIIRGSTPEDPGRFGEIKFLPNRIESPVDLAWFAKWYPSRMF